MSRDSSKGERVIKSTFVTQTDVELSTLCSKKGEGIIWLCEREKENEWRKETKKLMKIVLQLFLLLTKVNFVQILNKISVSTSCCLFNSWLDLKKKITMI